MPRGGGVWVAWGSFCKAQIPTESTETGSKTALPQWILFGFRRVKKIQKFHLLPRVTYVPTLTYALGAGVVQVGGLPTYLGYLRPLAGSCVGKGRLGLPTPNPPRERR